MLKKAIHKIVKHLLLFKKYFIAFGCAVIVLSILKIFSYSFFHDFFDSTYQAYFNETNKASHVRLPKNLNFAGEKVPTTDFSVRESIEKELIMCTYKSKSPLLLHKRANRWLPLIEPILKRYNIPNDFKYIPLIESQLTNIISSQGATGFWQLLKPTALEYGLEISEDIDERYNVEKSTEAACKYFKEAYKIFGNWTLVAASYNLGINGIQVQLKKQKVKDYYNLALTDETARFVFKILAIKEIISRPKVYGYDIRKRDLYPVISTKKITIDSTIHDLTAFSIAQNINYNVLKMYNPWLRTNKLMNSIKKKYTIIIPKNNFQIYNEDEIQYNNYDDSVKTKTSTIINNDTLN